MNSKNYQKTKGAFYVFDPIAKDYFRGMHRGSIHYTAHQWDAQVYKTLKGALTVAANLGGGFVVVDADGRQYND